MDPDQECLRIFNSLQENKKSPRQYLSYPPDSYKEWLAFISENNPAENNPSESNLQIGDAEEEDTQEENTREEKHVELHSNYLDILMPNLVEQSRDEKHVGNHVDAIVGTLDGHADTIMMTLDDIKANLEQNAPCNSTFLDGIDQRLQKLEETLHECSSWFVDTNFRKQSHQKKILTGSNEELLTARNLRLQQRGRQSAKSRGPFEDEGGRKSVENTTFPGFNNKMVSFPLPGTLDALIILNLVTHCSNIPTNLMESWKKLFFCNVSTSMLQNSFWWMWMDYFNPDEHAQSLLFDQIADDFVFLFTQTRGNKSADEIFMLYPMYFAQALFSSFCQAFPGSNEKISSVEFLNYLSNTTSEWIKGVKSQPEEWRSWPRHVLNPNSVLLPVERENMSTTVPSTSLGSTVINGNTIVGSPCQETATPSTILLPHSSIIPQTFSLSNISVEQVPTFERVQFSIYGRSPLLTHFLKHHHLIEQKVEHGPTMSRTQIMENPPLGTSYSEVFRCYVKKTNQLYKEYESEMAENDQRIVMGRKKLLKGLKKMETKNQSILQQQQEATRMTHEISTNTRAESKIYECSMPRKEDL